MVEATMSILSGSTGLTLLLGAVLLFLGGITLISHSMQIRRTELSHRVDLIAPPPTTAKKTATPAFQRMQLPHTPGGLPVRDQREIIRRLATLHVPAKHAMAVFDGLKGLSVLAMAGLGLGVASAVPALAGQTTLTMLVAIAFGIGGWFLPTFVIKRLVKARTESVSAGLPDALELLVVCVEAGLALEDGLERVVSEMRHSHPPLAEELALTAADLKILPSRDQALFNLADRIDNPKVRAVVTTLSQTMRYGTPLAHALRNVAADMRNESLLELEERANRLPTLLTLPMMLFIMPTIFLIVGGPAALRVIDALFH